MPACTPSSSHATYLLSGMRNCQHMYSLSVTGLSKRPPLHTARATALWPLHLSRRHTALNCHGELPFVAMLLSYWRSQYSACARSIGIPRDQLSNRFDSVIEDCCAYAHPETVSYTQPGPQMFYKSSVWDVTSESSSVVLARPLPHHALQHHI